jgi:glycerophosphoryl diester phosphodiesterase
VPEKDSGITIVTPGFLRLARRQGAEVYVWTVNDAQTMKRLVEAGVDGIITDYPDVLVAVLKEMGRR